MERDDFLDFLAALQTSCKEFKKKFSVKEQEWLTNLLKRDTDATEKGPTIYTVYELLCYFSLLSYIAKENNTSKLQCSEAKEANGYRFPKGPPAKKRNFAFFRFCFNNRTYDLCHGTGLPTKGGNERYPDISLQKVVSLTSDREPGKPVALWDAKYRSAGYSIDFTDPINAWFDSLIDIKPFFEDEILASLEEDIFSVSAVVTNVKENKESIEKGTALSKGYSVVFEYKGRNTGVGPIPSRQDHLEHRKKNAVS